MLWSWELIVTDRCVRIEGNVPACRKILHDLIALFPDADEGAPPDVVFGIRIHGGQLRLTLNGKCLWQGRHAGETAAAFEWHFYKWLVESLPCGLLSLHAATVSFRDRTLTFAGASGAGKSSLCTRALLAGGVYFSDEFTLLDEMGHVIPFPRPLQWSEDVHPAFSTQSILDSGLFTRSAYTFPDKDGRRVASVLWHPSRIARKPAPMEIVVLPQHGAEAPAAECKRLQRSQALLELAACVHQRPFGGDSVRLLHERIPPGVCFYRLVFSDVHAAWRRLLENPA